MKDNVAKKAVAKPAVKKQESSIQDDFADLTDGIQRIIDLGSVALSEAEEKTAKLAKIDEKSAEYERIVAEVKAAQARASDAFKQAEELIKATNELLPKDKK